MTYSPLDEPDPVCSLKRYISLFLANSYKKVPQFREVSIHVQNHKPRVHIYRRMDGHDDSSIAIRWYNKYQIHYNNTSIYWCNSECFKQFPDLIRQKLNLRIQFVRIYHINIIDIKITKITPTFSFVCSSMVNGADCEKKARFPFRDFKITVPFLEKVGFNPEMFRVIFFLQNDI